MLTRAKPQEWYTKVTQKLFETCEPTCRHVKAHAMKDLVTRRTGPGRQVLQGTNWQVQGSNGSNAAQPDQPWGSTLTFQHKVGVSWAQGSRHGVTMHPMGATFEGRQDPEIACEESSTGL